MVLSKTCVGAPKASSRIAYSVVVGAWRTFEIRRIAGNNRVGNKCQCSKLSLKLASKGLNDFASFIGRASPRQCSNRRATLAESIVTESAAVKAAFRD